MSNVRVDPIPLPHYTTFILEFGHLRLYKRLLLPCSIHHTSHMSLAYINHLQHRYMLSAFSPLVTMDRITCLHRPYICLYTYTHVCDPPPLRIPTSAVVQFYQICNAVEQRYLRWLQWRFSWTCFALEEGDSKFLRKVGNNLPVNTVIC